VPDLGRYGRLIDAGEFSYGTVGGKGVVGQKVGKRSGAICTIEPVRESADFVLATAGGGVVRIPREEMPVGKRTGVGLKSFPPAEDDGAVCGCTY
jgi:DNA gyrase/topoisomerase IV subunit A